MPLRALGRMASTGGRVAGDSSPCALTRSPVATSASPSSPPTLLIWATWLQPRMRPRGESRWRKRSRPSSQRGRRSRPRTSTDASTELV
eukprot:6301656-Heterocapsa_arctica.AAC.1